jgi:hypothetical protein
LTADIGGAEDVIADECEYVMMPRTGISRGRPAVQKMVGRRAGAFDRTRSPKIGFDAATSEWGVFEFVNEGTVASGIVDFAANSDSQSSAEPSTLIGHSHKVAPYGFGASRGSGATP